MYHEGIYLHDQGLNRDSNGVPGESPTAWGRGLMLFEVDVEKYTGS